MGTMAAKRITNQDTRKNQIQKLCQEAKKYLFIGFDGSNALSSQSEACIA
jgi:hypothetical protein